MTLWGRSCLVLSLLNKITLSKKKKKNTEREDTLWEAGVKEMPVVLTLSGTSIPFHLFLDKSSTSLIYHCLSHSHTFIIHLIQSHQSFVLLSFPSLYPVLLISYHPHSVPSAPGHLSAVYSVLPFPNHSHFYCTSLPLLFTTSRLLHPFLLSASSWQ